MSLEHIAYQLERLSEGYKEVAQNHAKTEDVLSNSASVQFYEDNTPGMLHDVERIREIGNEIMGILNQMQDAGELLAGTADGDHTIATDVRTIVNETANTNGEQHTQTRAVAVEAVDATDQSHQVLSTLAGGAIQEQRLAFGAILENLGGLKEPIDRAQTAASTASSEASAVSQEAMRLSNNFRMY